MPEVTSSVAWAGSKILARECRALNAAFLSCKSDDPNPETCAPLGLLVLNCANKAFNDIRSNCLMESTEYMECLDTNRGKFSSCRSLEFKLDGCFEGAKEKDAAAAAAGDKAKVAA